MFINWLALLILLEISGTVYFSLSPSRVLSKTFRNVENHTIYVVKWKVKVLVIQLCLTLCNPMNCSLPGSCVREILQVRILEWVAISFSRGFSQPKDQTQVGALQACSLPHEPPGKPIYVVGSILSFFQIQMQQNLLSTYYGCQTPWEITFSDIRPQRDF